MVTFASWSPRPERASRRVHAGSLDDALFSDGGPAWTTISPKPKTPGVGEVDSCRHLRRDLRTLARNRRSKATWSIRGHWRSTRTSTSNRLVLLALTD